MEENPCRDETLSLKAKALADYLYERTAASKVTGKKTLLLSMDQEAMASLLPAVGTEAAHPALSNIALLCGQKDLYYYDKSIMTLAYAKLDAMLSDKDILTTIAAVTREDSRLYPRPTQFAKLMTTPFRFTRDEILGAAARMRGERAYEDIGTITASNGAMAFYSSKYLKEGYAKALLEWIEVGEKENP